MLFFFFSICVILSTTSWGKRAGGRKGIYWVSEAPLNSKKKYFFLSSQEIETWTPSLLKNYPIEFCCFFLFFNQLCQDNQSFLIKSIRIVSKHPPPKTGKNYFLLSSRDKWAPIGLKNCFFFFDTFSG